MKEEKTKKYFLLLVLIFWMGVIFAFSAQPAVESGKISDSVCYKAVSEANSLLRLKWNEEQIEMYAAWLSFPVRKAAHMTEYAILAILAWWNRKVWKRAFNRQNYTCAFLFAVVYAMTDEFHQTFVSGRSGNLTDVCIDGIGACLGLLCLAIVRRWSGRKPKELFKNNF